jgi:kinesin family protein 11
MATRSKSRVRLPSSSSSISLPQTSTALPSARSQGRPPSALQKGGTLQQSGTSEDIPGPRFRPPTSIKPQDPENNIQVVIRCRRRSEREINDASPIIVQMDGAKSQDISIETSVPTSSFGVVTLPPTRKYPFDMVFGPEASQELVYDEVVQPMLDEVLEGYNCTLFAYGQTGTGKTYVLIHSSHRYQLQLMYASSHTMQGDLTLTPMGNPSMQAGMIPRVLFRLFHKLETSNADYSVKISYVELYNEELRDLLAPELAAPSGSTQPMGQGLTKEASILKIFDDSSKKGVFIQGLEDCPVKDRADALTLLTKGSQRRQIAATKFNDHSSRSHSIFTITVHVKETSSIGDDLLKVGKLNLVDLAGSENIGRSGAENKRAREAGMINQSLLTLGRVINALVDKSSHVPYR